jgi:hypothetical protein
MRGFLPAPIENIARKSPNFTKISQYYREYSIYDNIAKFSQYYSEILGIFFNRDISQFNSEFSQYYIKILAIFFNPGFHNEIAILAILLRNFKICNGNLKKKLGNSRHVLNREKTQ